MRRSVGSIIRFIENSQYEPDKRHSAPEQHRRTRSGKSRLPAQPQSKWYSTFPSGPEHGAQFQNSKKDLESKHKCPEPRSPSESVQERFEEANVKEVQCGPMLPPQPNPGPFSVSMSPNIQGNDVKLTEDQDRYLEDRLLSSEIKHEAHVHAIFGFGKRNRVKGKGKQKDEDSSQCTERREYTSTAAKSLHRAEIGLPNEATQDLVPTAGPSEMYIAHKPSFPKGDKSDSPSERSLVISRPDCQPPQDNSSLNILPQIADQRQSPSPRPEDFYRPIMVSVKTRRSSSSWSDISLLRKNRCDEYNSLMPKPLFSSASSSIGNAHGWMTAQTYHIPIGLDPYQHQVPEFRRASLHPQSICSRSDNFSWLDLPSETTSRPPTASSRCVTAFSYMLPAAASPFSTPYGVSNECIFPTHRLNEPPSHCVNGGFLEFEEIRQVWNQQHSQRHMSKPITEIIQSQNRLQKQILTLLGRQDQNEQQPSAYIHVPEQASAISSWGLTPDELYDSPQWREQREKRRCKMWKRLFCRCCTFASPKITTAPWAPASGFMFAPSLSLNSPPISAPSAEVQNTEEKLKILGDTIIAPTTLTDRPKKPKWWQRKHTASRKPKNGRLRKKYPNAQ